MTIRPSLKLIRGGKIAKWPVTNNFNPDKDTDLGQDHLGLGVMLVENHVLFNQRDIMIINRHQQHPTPSSIT